MKFFISVSSMSNPKKILSFASIAVANIKHNVRFVVSVLMLSNSVSIICELSL